jgi:hypothetical protein
VREAPAFSLFPNGTLLAYIRTEFQTDLYKW